MKLGVGFRASLGIGLLAFVVCGCHSGNKLIKKGSGIFIGSSSDLKPDADPGPQVVNYGGTEIPVNVKTTRKDDQFQIDLWYQGADMETEKYRSLPTEFDLENAAGEDYTPPIPLLYFPMNAGDSWKWSGQMMTGPTGRKATAVVSTREEEIDVGTVVHALVVEVDLSMESGASAPATRELNFWFVKDKGLVKREFGASTSRAPATSKDPG